MTDTNRKPYMKINDSTTEVAARILSPHIPLTVETQPFSVAFEVLSKAGPHLIAEVCTRRARRWREKVADEGYTTSGAVYLAKAMALEELASDVLASL